jgi:hypothetical protein
MALSQKGAGYPGRDHIKDQFIRDAHDDHASKIQAILTQGNFSALGTPKPPEAPIAVNVAIQNGLYTVTIQHPKPPSGIRWNLEYSTDPNFQTPIPVDLGEVNVWQNYIPNQKLYFRARAKFLASENSPWVYFGGAAAPQAA